MQHFCGVISDVHTLLCPEAGQTSCLSLHCVYSDAEPGRNTQILIKLYGVCQPLITAAIKYYCKSAAVSVCHHYGKVLKQNSLKNMAFMLPSIKSQK